MADVAVRINPDTIRIAFCGVERLAASWVRRRIGNYLLLGILGGLTEGVVDMGWYLRKSLSFGPLRINLSKSGLGMSAGIRGIRVGAGPRGKYLHAGREGLYYRASLDTHAEQATSTAVREPANAELDSSLNDLTEDQQLAATRADDRSGGRGFIGGLLRGIFGGLLRGR